VTTAAKYPKFNGYRPLGIPTVAGPVSIIPAHISFVCSTRLVLRFFAWARYSRVERI
jgi:hypothetical protein